MTDYDLQKQLAEDRRKKFLAQSEYQGPQGQMVGGHFVAPNALEYLAAGLRSIGGMAGESMAGNELKQIESQRTEGTKKALANFLRQSQGTPESAPADGMGPTMPAVKPNIQGAYGALMESPDASLRQMGIQGQLSFAQKQAEKAQQAEQMKMLAGMTPQQAIAAGVSPELVKQYAESKNYGRAKVDWKDANGSLVPVTEYGDRPEGIGQIEKTGNPYTDMLVRGQDGQIVQNTPLINVKTQLAQAGRSAPSQAQPYFQPVQTAQGVMAFNARTGRVEPVMSQQGQAVIGAAADPALQGQIAGAKESGEQSAKLKTENTKNLKRSSAMLSQIEQAEALLNQNPTESGIGSFVDAAGRMVGVSSKSAQIAGQLEAISGWLTSNVPRMEGAQSNVDLQNYQAMAGKVGDRTIPVPERLAALKGVRQLQEKYKQLNQESAMPSTKKRMTFDAQGNLIP
jgi:hypothetical protein